MISSPFPAFISTVKSDPTTCGGQDGSITISGLNTSTTYVIDYDSNGVAAQRTLISSAFGEIVLTGLNENTYSNITATAAGCESNTESETLLGPNAPTIATVASNPTTCNGQDGTITISGLIASTAYQVDYDSLGISVTKNLISDASGEILLAGLNEGAYSNIAVTIAGCTSNLEDEVLVDPSVPVIATVKSDPTSCDGTDGFITITGLLPSTTYTIDYDSVGVAKSESLLSDASGEIVLAQLGSGNYSGITATLNGCTSLPRSRNLVDPGVPNITVAKTDPTTCSGSDGTFTVSGLTPLTTYTVEYDSATIAKSFSLTSDASGDIVRTGLPQGTYANIRVVLLGCESNSLSVSLSEPGTPSISTTKTDLTSCGGTDGTITISGLTAAVTYQVDYDSVGVAKSESLTADALGTIVLTDLGLGAYTNITVSLNGCTSNAENQSLSEPGVPSILTTKSDPSTCGGNDGGIIITGLTPSTSYVLNYDSLGVSVLLNMTSDASGEYQIVGLTQGTYANIMVTLNGCSSNVQTQNLADPSTPSILTTKVDPTTCGGLDGAITITNLMPSTSYVIAYDSLGTAVSQTMTTDVSGEIAISGLGEGAYLNITASLSGCTSNSENENLVGPSPANIASVKTDPTTCGGNDGTITITGVDPSTMYTVEFDSVGVNKSMSMLSDGVGEILIANLGSGVYDSISVVFAGCVSNYVNEALADPTPPSITTRFTEPTSCGGTDGTISIEGLIAGETYEISYDSVGVSKMASMLANASGEITLVDLGQGAYTNITATLNNCESNPETETLTDPNVPSMSTTSTNPTTCGGSEGAITISGLEANTMYVINYDSSTVASSRILQSDLNGDIVIAGLGAGDYENITVTLNGCTSTPTNEYLVDPNAPTILTAGTSPTSCSGNDGFIVISALNPGDTYNVSYDSLGTLTSFTSIADAGGNIRIDSLISGTYDTIAVLLNGCLSNAENHTLVDPNAPVINSNKTDPISCGGVEGFVTITGLTNGENYEVNYDSNGVSKTFNAQADVNGEIQITDLGEGVYDNITVSLNNCVSNSERQTLTDPSVPVIATLKADPITCGGDEGQVIVTGLSPTITYEVYFDSADVSLMRTLTADANGEAFITGLSAGLYDSVYVVLNNCTSNLSDEILSDPTPPVISTGKVDPTTCDGDEGQLIVRGLIAGETYRIDFDSAGIASSRTLTADASGQAFVSGLDANTYSNITATLNNCTSNAEQEILVGPSPAIPFLAKVDPTTCGGTEGEITISNLEVDKVYQIDYMDNATAVTLTDTSDATGVIVLSGLDEGAYANLIISADNCFSDPVQTDLIGPIPAVVNWTPTDPSTCGGNDGSIFFTGLAVSETYELDYTLNGTVQATQTISSTAVGTYEFTGLTQGVYTDLTFTVDNCTSNVVVDTLRDPAAPVFTLNQNDPTQCGASDGTILIDGLGASATYNVSFVFETVQQNLTDQVASATGRITIGGFPEGTVDSVTVERFNCVSSDGPVNFDAPDLPVIALTADKNQICLDELVTLTLQGHSGTIAWQDSSKANDWTDMGNDDQNIVIVSPDTMVSPSSYRSIITFGLCMDTSNIQAVRTVKVESGMPSVLDPDFICEGSSTDLILAGADGDIQWQQFTSGSWINATGATNAVETVSPDADDSPVLYRAVVTRDGCLDVSDTAIVTVYPVPALNVTMRGDNNFCEGSTAVFEKTSHVGGGSNPVFNWYVNDALVHTGEMFVSNSISDDAVVRLEMISDSVCANPTTREDDMIMNVIEMVTPLVDIEVDEDQQCEGETFNFTITNQEGEGNNPSYTWLVNDVDMGVGTNAFSSDSLENGDAVRLILSPVLSQCMTKTADTSEIIVVVIDEVPVAGDISPISAELCAEETGLLQLNDFKGDIQWQSSADQVTWTDIPGETSPQLNTSPYQVIGERTTAVAYSYRANVTLLINDCPDAASVPAKITQFPVIQDSVDFYQSCEESVVELTPEDGHHRYTEFLFWENSEDGEEWTYFGDDAISLTDTSIKDMEVRAVFGSNGGPDRCRDTSYFVVTACEPPPIDIPNAMTPNDDDENDVFWIKNIWFYPENTLRVYNRWGNLVYEAEGYNNYWDGTRNGKDLPDATYYYVLDLGNGDASYEGTITILR